LKYTQHDSNYSYDLFEDYQFCVIAIQFSFSIDAGGAVVTPGAPL
jgi:hypothetical protein